MQRRPHALLDTIAMIYGTKTDLELADKLIVSPASISRIRNGTQPVSPEFILNVHERTKLTVEVIRELIKVAKERFVKEKDDEYDEKLGSDHRITPEMDRRRHG
jgi:transcriptional regulator with XRE-family HTH domain